MISMKTRGRLEEEKCILTVVTKPYHLKDASLEYGPAARFRATLIGPPACEVWSRAWISNEEGALAETAVGPLPSGSHVCIDVPWPEALFENESAEYVGVIRIESQPLCTEDLQVFAIDLSQAGASRTT
jgi:hypothetical protein